MQRLSLSEQAYIRPSPSKGILGGIAPNSGEVITLLQHANYDLIFVETVGVGQSEVHVSQVTDMLLMLMNISGGDELQGIKKGMMEYVFFCYFFLLLVSFSFPSSFLFFHLYTYLTNICNSFELLN
jgi:LAO/AO transport system kinase